MVCRLGIMRYLIVVSMMHIIVCKSATYFCSFLIIPDSILPSIMVPMSLYLAAMGIMKGALSLRSSACMLSRYSSSDGPSYQGASSY
jgi:hypothetical protein